MTVKDLIGTPNKIPVDYTRLPESVSPGSLVFLNDGFIQLQVNRVSGEEVFCLTVIGGPLLSHKGLALPGVKIFADAVSDKDLQFVAFALHEGVDVFGVLFGETADDCLTGFILFALTMKQKALPMGSCSLWARQRWLKKTRE